MVSVSRVRKGRIKFIDGGQMRMSRLTSRETFREPRVGKLQPIVSRQHCGETVYCVLNRGDAVKHTDSSFVGLRMYQVLSICKSNDQELGCRTHFSITHKGLRTLRPERCGSLLYT